MQMSKKFTTILLITFCYKNAICMFFLNLEVIWELKLFDCKRKVFMNIFLNAFSSVSTVIVCLSKEQIYTTIFLQRPVYKDVGYKFHSDRKQIRL